MRSGICSRIDWSLRHHKSSARFLATCASTFRLSAVRSPAPRLQGSVKPGGADFGTLRTDGVFLVDVRGTLESRDGALIEITYTGVMDLGPDGYEKFLRGQVPATAAVHAAPRFRTAHPDYAWMNRLHWISIGQATSATPEVLFDVYALK